MYKYGSLLLLLTVTNIILCAKCAATPKFDEKNETESGGYDANKFDEVYDERQNGGVNYKVGVNGVVLVWAPPESLIPALALLESGLLDEQYTEIEEIVKPGKPDNVPVVHPEKPSSSTTTSLPPSVEENNLTQDSQNSTVHRVVKRRYRLPGFMRPFIKRRIRL